MSAQVIIGGDAGFHNRNLEEAADRLIKGKSYRDLSTVCVVPTRGMIHARVVQSWMGMMTAMNQKFTRIFVTNMEVADAYNSAINTVLANPELSTWKYLLTLEEDNMPPPDGLLKLYESMDTFDVVGGLYWTKGEGGQPMIYGDPRSPLQTFIPQVPKVDALQEACGLGMGFNLFKMDIFRDRRVPQPWFKTLQEYSEGAVRAYTQDLYFYENIRKAGYRVACDTRVKVGHYDVTRDIVW